MKACLFPLILFFAVINGVVGFHAMTRGNWSGARACFFISLLFFFFWRPKVRR